MILGKTPLHYASNNFIYDDRMKTVLIAHGAYDINDWKNLIQKREVDKIINYLSPIQDKVTVVNTPDRDSISCFH